MARTIKRKNIEFDAIAIQGNSGALLGGGLSLKTGKNLILCRKPAMYAHNNVPVEGETDFHSYIIVDDLIASGKTINQISGITFIHSRLAGEPSTHACNRADPSKNQEGDLILKRSDGRME